MREKIFTLNLKKHYYPEEYIDAIDVHHTCQSENEQVKDKYVFAPGYIWLIIRFFNLVVF